MPLELRSSCKINLLLNILGRRPDGFHELETVLQPVPLFDRIVLETGGSGVELTCSDSALPTGGSNLVHRAATAFLRTAGISAGVRLRLEKHVPVAAGLGGGSGNAAATLLGLNELFGQPLPGETITRLAESLGSDVPFFLQSRPALATGRGERIQPLDFFRALDGVWVLLIHPGFGVSTAWAYQQLGNFPASLNGQPGRAGRLVGMLQEGPLAHAATGFFNSLEAPVFHKYPVLALYQRFLRSEGASAALMSGSGSTTFALFDNQAQAFAAREKLLARFGAACWTEVVALGPAASETLAAR